MSLTKSIDDVLDNPIELSPCADGFFIEPRCHVCRNEEIRKTVNDLLASGLSYAMILRALGEVNGALDERDRVTVDSIGRHAARHFPVQHAARATYREIVERRAREAQIDFVNGAATAITPMAFLETVMAKGYADAVDEHTRISYRDGMAAAVKLAEALRQAEGEVDIAQMNVQWGRMITAIKEFIPQERWPEVQARLRGEPSSQTATSRVPHASPVGMVSISDVDDEE